MATFRVTIQVGDLEGSRYESMEALLNTGASHLVMPRKVLERLDVPVDEHWPFELADNTVGGFDVGEVRPRLDGRESFCRVGFGESRVPALLGTISLELLHLGVDPMQERLVPLADC